MMLYFGCDSHALWFILSASLFMKMHLFALPYDNCSDLVCCAFQHKLSGCVRNIMLRLEIPSGKCAELRTVTARNNRGHMP